MIVHAAYENGFVPNALLVFSTKTKKTDYHHDMNSMWEKAMQVVPKNHCRLFWTETSIIMLK